MTKFLFLLLTLLPLYLSSSVSSSSCVCLDIYQPVCGKQENTYFSFPSDCHAKCYGFEVVHQGKCFSRLQKIDGCKAHCPSTFDMVCASNAQNKTKSFINSCFAKCEKFDVIVQNSTCDSKRILGFSSSVTNWWNKTTTAIKSTFSSTKAWFEDKSAKLANGTQQLWHKTKAGWENCSCFIMSDIENGVGKLINTTKKIANKTKEGWNSLKNATKQGLDKLKNKTKEGINKLVNGTKNAWKAIKGKSVEQWQKVKNASKKAWGKVKTTIATWKNNTLDFANKTKIWFIEKGQKIKNNTISWWRKTKAGWEDCTCCLLNKTMEVIERIETQAQKAINKTKEKFKEVVGAVKNGTIAFINKGKAEIQKAKTWVEKLKPCLCTRDYVPVCVETPEGERATILNPCYAKCGDLKVIVEGVCEE